MNPEIDKNFIERMYLTIKNHHDILEHMITLLMKSEMENKAITDEELKLCMEWYNSMDDDYLFISDLFHTSKEISNERGC